MTFRVLVNIILCLSEGTLQTREEMGHGLSIVPHMLTGAVATAPVVSTAFPNPVFAVVLTHDSGGFKYVIAAGKCWSKFKNQSSQKNNYHIQEHLIRAASYNCRRADREICKGRYLAHY